MIEHKDFSVNATGTLIEYQGDFSVSPQNGIKQL
jgi:hypothetical protein